VKPTRQPGKKTKQALKNKTASSYSMNVKLNFFKSILFINKRNTKQSVK
jgi:hypothetical protein